MTPLIQAVMNNDVQEVLDLLACGADVDGRAKKFEETPLGLLATHDENSFSPDQLLQMAKILVEAGADVNAVNSRGDSALHKASFFFNSAMIEYLLSCGANINLCNKLNCTPLHKVVDQVHVLTSGMNFLENLEELQLRVAKTLLKYKPDVNIKNSHGQTPFFLATRHNYFKVAELLIDYNETDINTTSPGDGTASLHWAACTFNKKLIKALIKKGAYIDAMDNTRRTPLMWVLENLYSTAHIDDRDHKQLQTLKFLLKKNSNINTVDSRGKNILTINSILDNDCLKIILEHLAKLSVQNISVDSRLLKTIADQKSFNNYYAKCIKELLEAKNTKIHDYSVTYFDLLDHDKRKLMNYAANEDLVNQFEKSDFKKSFKIYAPIMQNNMNKAVKKFKLHNSAARSLKKLLPVDLTDLVIKRIINLLDKLDLQKLSESK